MADADNYPTAIIPTRPVGIEKRFDALAEQFADPLVTLFMFARGGNADDGLPVSHQLRFDAAKELVQYRHPKLRAETVTHKGALPGPAVNIQINFGPTPSRPSTPPTVDVTPSPAPVDPLS